MSDISTKILVNQLKTLLREGIQGPNKDWSYFTKEYFRVIETVDLSNEEVLSGVIGAIAHVAYHLGAIRQKLAESDL